MALIKDGVVYRNLQEQVQKNADDIQEIKEYPIPDPVYVSEETLEGAPTAYSIMVGKDGYNFPVGGGGGSTVSASTQAVPGALDAYSINIDGTDYNIPTGGGSGETYFAGYGIVFNQGKENDTSIEIDTQIVAEKSELQSEADTRQEADSNLQGYCDVIYNIANEKSTVSVAGSGTSTTRVNYITVDGTEYELPQPQGGGATWGTITGNIANQQDLMQITSGLESEISDEVNRAEAAEAALNQSILERATISYVDQADLELSEQISGEATTRRSDVQTLTNNLSAETTRASEAEATLNTAILARATIEYVDAADQELDTQIGNEITARTNADTNITNTILSGKKIAVVSTLPASPDVNTIYFITGA